MALRDAGEAWAVDILQGLGRCLGSGDELHVVLARVVQCVSAISLCDSCFVYLLQGSELVLSASKHPHPDAVDCLTLQVGQGITGWVAEHGQPAVMGRKAFEDPRFERIEGLPEDWYEALLSVPILCRGRVVGVINVQHERSHAHRRREIQLISTIGFLAGAGIEIARLECENSALSERLGTRKIVERAKGILQRDLGVTEEAAYLTIQRQSRERRRPTREIAEAVILADDLRRASAQSP